MKKYILVEFPDGFIPPEKFDGVEDAASTGVCEKCPFYTHDCYEPIEDCCLSDEKNLQCPIREYFI